MPAADFHIFIMARQPDEDGCDTLARFKGAFNELDLKSKDVAVAYDLDEEDREGFMSYCDGLPATFSAWVDFDLGGRKLYSGWIAWAAEQLNAAIDLIAAQNGQERVSTEEIYHGGRLN